MTTGLLSSRKLALCCLLVSALAAARVEACNDKCLRCREAFGRGCLKCNADVTACLRCASARYEMKDGVCVCAKSYGTFASAPDKPLPASWPRACRVPKICTCRKCPRAAPLGVGGPARFASCYGAKSSMGLGLFALSLATSGSACSASTVAVVERAVGEAVQALPGVEAGSAAAHVVKCLMKSGAPTYALSVALTSPSAVTDYVIAAANGGGGSGARRLLETLPKAPICSQFGTMCTSIASGSGETVTGSSAGYAAPASAAPGPPTNVVTASLTTSAWHAAWVDSAPAGDPPEVYALKCVARGDACGASAVAGSVGGSGIARGVQAGEVTGLAAGMNYTCYVIASNWEAPSGVCSDGVSVTIYRDPSAPSALAASAITTTTATFTWADSEAPSVPEETVRVRCAEGAGMACGDAAAAESAPVARGIQLATVTGLAPAKTYTCFAVAASAATPGAPGACSGPATISTQRYASAPTALALMSADTSSAAFTWVDGQPAGDPPERVRVRCIEGAGRECGGGGGAGAAVVESAPVDRGVQAAAVAGLTPATTYTCFAVAESSIGSACSGPLGVEIVSGLPAPTHVMIAAGGAGGNDLTVTYTPSEAGAATLASCTVTVSVEAQTYGGPAVAAPAPLTVPASGASATFEGVEFLTTYGVRVMCTATNGAVSPEASAAETAAVGGLPTMSFAVDRQMVGEREIISGHRTLQGLALAPSGDSYFLSWIGTSYYKQVWRMNRESTTTELGMCYPYPVPGISCHKETVLAQRELGGDGNEPYSVATDDRGRVYVAQKGLAVHVFTPEELLYINTLSLTGGDNILGISVMRAGPSTLHMYVARNSSYASRLERWVVPEFAGGSVGSAFIDTTWAAGGRLSLGLAPYSAKGVNNVVVDAADGTIYTTLRVGAVSPWVDNSEWKVARIPAASAAGNLADGVMFQTVGGAFGLALYKSRVYVTQYALRRTVTVLNKHTLGVLAQITNVPPTRINITEPGLSYTPIVGNADIRENNGLFEIDVDPATGEAFVADQLWRYFPAVSSGSPSAYVMNAGTPTSSVFYGTRLYFDRVLKARVW